MKIQNLCLAGAVAAAFLSISASAVNAADMTTTDTTTNATAPTTNTIAPTADTTSTTSTTTMTPAAMPANSMMPMGTIDYKTLIHPMWDYTDLQGAKAYGLTDMETATVAKIAWKTGWTFNDVLAMVQRGESFGFIAQKANMKLADVMDASDTWDKISAYKMAYEHSGQKAMMMDSSSKM